MNNQLLNNDELEFPVDWNYKIIAEKNYPDFINKICQILTQQGIKEIPVAGRESSSGKYISYKLTVSFNSREDMKNISEAIAQAPGVKFLI